jgi:hypothetical protein
MRAVADTGFGDTEPAISGADPIGALVFSQAPGGAAAVSADTGKSVFGGAIGTRGAAGDYTFPQSFRPPDELAQGCPPLAALADPLGYDLRDGSALAQADVEAAVAAVRQTAIPSAFRRGGRVFVEVVLLYPRIVDAFDPAAAEWVVLVNGGNLM